MIIKVLVENNRNLGGKKMIKIAVANDKGLVTEHFGHCEGFLIYDAEEGNVIHVESVLNPGHRPGFLPNFLNEKGVNVIVSGGMGGAAVDIFNERDIEVIVGVSGQADEAVAAYLKGELQSTGSVCHQHAHEGDCGE